MNLLSLCITDSNNLQNRSAIYYNRKSYKTIDSSVIYKENLLNTLSELFNECSEKNWDGYDALPLSVTAYNEAVKIIELLPSDLLKKVEVSPLNDGGIAFEWYRKKHYIFSMAVTGQNEITYSGLYGVGNESYGKENFSPCQFPVKLIELIKSVYY